MWSLCLYVCTYIHTAAEATSVQTECIGPGKADADSQQEGKETAGL